MPNIRTLQRSFGGGEVTPEFFGRIDDTKFQTGLALCRNFIVLPHGPVANRPGFAFVRAVKDSTKKTRLIPFTYSTDQTMVIEIGAGYFRFHTQGATLMDGAVPYEITNPYAEADLFDIHYVQSADVLTLVHPNHAPRELRRLGALDWRLDVVTTAPQLSPPGGGQTTGGTPIAHEYVVTSLWFGYPPGTAPLGGFESFITLESNPSAPVSVSNDLELVGAANRITWSGVSEATGYRIYKKRPGGFYSYLGQATGTTFLDDFRKSAAIDDSVGPPTTTNKKIPTGLVATAITAGTAQLSAVATVPSGVANTITYRYVVTACTEDPARESARSSEAACNNDLFATGAKNTVSWPLVAGADYYKIYRESSGLFGYVGQATQPPFVDQDNITADIGRTPPLNKDLFVGTGNYPAAVTYFEQRRVFAGSINQPQNIWMTRPGTEADMAYSIPSKEDDSIAFRVAAREANTIRHALPLDSLVLLTGAAEWRVTSVNSDAITPSSVAVRPQSYIGAGNAQPVIVNTNVLYGAARGGHVRELAYNWQAGGYITGDLSLRAPHLFDGFDIKDIAFQKAPAPVAWFVSSSGKLLGLTYVPEQQVGAWHQHDTDGTFESVACVAEGAEDAVYAVVRRTINGQSVRYIERMAPRLFGEQENAFFVDSGLTYDGPPAGTISGLSHLEGCTVSILADGAVHPPRVVSSGAVQLDVEASVVHIGLPIEADAQTLPLAFEIQGFGQGRQKNVNKAWLRVYRSSGIFAGPSFDRLTEAKQRTIEPYGSPPALKSEEIPIVITPSWTDNGQVCVRQSDPLPLTIVSMSLEVSIGG